MNQKTVKNNCVKKPVTSGLLKDIGHTFVMSLVTGLAASVLLGIPVLLFSLSAHAEIANESVITIDNLPRKSVDKVHQGSLLLKLASSGVSAEAPLLETDVSMRVSGVANRVEVKQQFRNPTANWVEGVYVFPLPENSAVDRLKMRIGDRVIEGEIKEKGEAKRIYTAAKQQGKRATLLSQQRPNIFTTAVANIGPGEKVEVIIEYQQLLHYDAGRFSLRFPMIVGPRYIPGKVIEQSALAKFSGNGWAADTDQVPDASEITPPVVDPQEKKINPVSIEIQLDAGFPLAQLESRFHPVQVSEHSDGYQIIRLEQRVPADRDFELVWAPEADHEPKGALFNEQWQGEDYALLMVMPPSLEEFGANTQSRELVFVVDTSGSMHGTSMAQAKAALTLALSRLKPGDRFNIIQFDDSTRSLFNQAQSASEINLQSALAYVNSLGAGGGTEMLPALQRALRSQQEMGLLRQVVFLTDGSVGNEVELFTAIQKNLGNTRLFTVGIGSAPNSYFMTRAANFGRGTFTYIGNVAEVQQKMGELFGKLESPALTDIKVEWLDGAEAEMWPVRIPDLYLDEPVVLSAKLSRAGAGVRLTGRINGSDWQQQIRLDGGATHEGVRVIWARRKIADLMDQKAQGMAESTIRPKVQEIALQHHLVSKYTSLVAVDKTPARPIDESLDSKVLPTNLPHGWNAKKVFGSLPQTSTVAPLHFLVGIASLFLALMAGWWKSFVGYINRTNQSNCQLEG